MDATTTAATINAGVSRVLLQTININHEVTNATRANANALFDSLSNTSQNASPITTRATRRRHQPACDARRDARSRLSARKRGSGLPFTPNPLIANRLPPSHLPLSRFDALL